MVSLAGSGFFSTKYHKWDTYEEGDEKGDWPGSWIVDHFRSGGDCRFVVFEVCLGSFEIFFCDHYLYAGDSCCVQPLVLKGVFIENVGVDSFRLQISLEEVSVFAFMEICDGFQWDDSKSRGC